MMNQHGNGKTTCYLVDDDMFSPPSCCRHSDKLCFNYATKKQEPIGIQEPV